MCFTRISHTRRIMTQCVLAILKEHSFPYKMISKAFYKLISSLRNMRYRWCSRGVKILTEGVNFDLSYLKTGWSEWTHILHIILLWYLLSIEIWNIKIGDPSIRTIFSGYIDSLLINYFITITSPLNISKTHLINLAVDKVLYTKHIKNSSDQFRCW